MTHIMRKIADWLVEEEENEAEKCSIPDEIIDEWLQTLEERIEELRRENLNETEEYAMLLDLRKRVQRIEEVRREKCRQFKDVPSSSGAGD